VFSECTWSSGAYFASDRSSSDEPGECDAVSPTIGAIHTSAMPAGTTSDA